MTSQPDVEVERELIVRQDDDRGATSTEDGVQQLSKKEAITDGVIRQLIDQITQLQRASDMHYSRVSLQPAVNH